MGITCGKIWRRVGGGTVGNVKLLPHTTNTPVGGDLCYKVGGLLQSIITSVGTDSQLIEAICVEGISELDLMNSPGYTAASGSAPSRVAFGGYGSRDASQAAGKRKMFLPVTPDLQWVMSIQAAGADPSVGTQYGFVRVGAGDYVLDSTDTAALDLEILGLYSPDVDAGLTLVYTAGPPVIPRARVWVRAVNPGNGL